MNCVRSGLLQQLLSLWDLDSYKAVEILRNTVSMPRLCIGYNAMEHVASRVVALNLRDLTLEFCLANQCTSY
jgi:hypothetical protein